MEFQELIQKRISIRSYKSDPVEKDKLERILKAANLAPTAHNRQAFKILVIRTEGRKKDLKKIYNTDWFVEAPIILAVYSIPGKNWVRSDKLNYHHVDAAIVMDHIILAAENEGLGTCWIGAFDPDAARSFAGLGDAYEPVAFTPLGYPGSYEYRKVRKSLEEMVIYV